MIAGFRTRENGRRVESCPCKPGLPYTYFSGWFPNPGLTRFSYSGFSSFFTRVQDKQRDRRQRQKLDQRSYAQRLLLRLLPEGFSSSSLPSAKCFYTSRSKHARGSFQISHISVRQHLIAISPVERFLCCMRYMSYMQNIGDVY